jgi:hypothetical protein
MQMLVRALLPKLGQCAHNDDDSIACCPRPQKVLQARARYLPNQKLWMFVVARLNISRFDLIQMQGK